MRARFFLLVLCCGLLGRALLGPPAEPDLPFPFPKVLGCLLLFLAWLGGSWGWGAWALARAGCAGRGAARELAAGFAVLSLAIMAFGHLGLVGFAAIPLPAVFLLAGAILAPLPRPLPAIPWPPPAEGAALFAVMLCVALASFRLHSFWDPLWYHLNGPRLWAEAGRIFFPSWEAMAYNAASWDSLYLWAHLLVGGPGGGGLIPAQLFAQWMHCAAYACTAFAFRDFCAAFAPRGPWCNLAVLAGLVPAPLLFTASLGKNDWGANLWFYSAFALLVEPGERGGRGFLAGLLLGLAVTAKMTVAATMAPLLGAVLFLFPSARALLPLLGAGLTCGAFPVLARNLAGTGNPFFPLFSGIAPGSQPRSWGAGFAAIAGGGASPLGILLELAAFSPFFFLGMAGLALPGRKPLEWALPFVCLASLALLVAMAGENTLLRWWGPGLMLAVALFFLQLSGWEERLAFLRRKQRLVAAGLALALLWLAPVPWKSLLGSQLLVDPAIQIRLHPGGQALAWIRMNRPHAGVAVLNDLRLYYFRPAEAVRIWDSLGLSPGLARARDPKELLQVLDKAGFDLLFDSVESLDAFGDAFLIRSTREALTAHPEVLVFSDASGRVAEIKALLLQL